MYKNFGEAIRRAVFQVVSITTTTGYVTADFDRWPSLAKGVLFILMFVGGCAGSTGGSMKQIRVLILIKKVKQSLVQLIFPSAIVSSKIGKQAVSQDAMDGVLNFFLMYICLFIVFTLSMLAIGLDLISAVASVAATIGNIGPGLGSVGAAENYAFLPDIGKFILCISMLLGRLELFTILVLFLPSTWRK